MVKKKNRILLCFEVTPDEKKKIFSIAEKENYRNASEWIRKTLLDKADEVNKE